MIRRGACDSLGSMPRTIRAVEGGGYYHVLNRGNGRLRLFHSPRDYDAFERVLAEALARAGGGVRNWNGVITD